MANKIFKIGTLLYDDDDKEWELIISVEKLSHESRIYQIFNSTSHKPYTITDSGLNRMVEKGYWKIEYEPESV
jgi:hypothetical protein